MEATFHAVARVGDLPDNGKKLVNAGGKTILLCHSDGQYFAVENRCTHDNEALQGGTVRKCTIVCPIHGARFRLKDGRSFGAPAFEPITTYPLRIEGEEIQVCPVPA